MSDLCCILFIFEHILLVKMKRNKKETEKCLMDTKRNVKKVYKI